MTKAKKMRVFLIIVVVAIPQFRCGSDNVGDRDADSDRDADVDTDSDADTDSDGDADTGHDTGGDSDTLSDSEIRTEVDTEVQSGNPIIKHLRTADPSAHVWSDGKVWIYTSHDMDDAEDYSSMDGYHAFSSYDMVNWTDHGEILHSRDVSWAVGGSMYAPAAAYENGMYYLYFPTMSNEWKWRVGVATSPVPEGPFTDVGHFIEGTDHIDPACFIDDDGTAYLYWGGGDLPPKMARLKSNMTELAEEPRIVDYGNNDFGEGSYMHKAGAVYYFSYRAGGGARYSMGDNPYGPFDYTGTMLSEIPGAQPHHSVINYHDRSYLFYHVGNYNGGTLYRRNVCVDYLYYNPDGTIQEVIPTAEGVYLLL